MATFEIGTRLDEAGNDVPALGFVHADIFITDPTVSSCGRFIIDPLVTYGISPCEARLLRIANAALTADHYKGEVR